MTLRCAKEAKAAESARRKMNAEPSDRTKARLRRALVKLTICWG